MAIAFRSATEAGSASVAASLDINVPSGVQDGDHLVLFGVTADGDDGGFETITGWTEEVDAATFNTGGSAPSPPGMSVWRRIASSEPADYTLIPAAGQTGICAKMIAFSGGDGTTQWDVAETTATGDGTNADPPSITPTTDGAITVVAAFWDSTNTVWSAAPSGYTDSDSLGSVTGNGGGNGCTCAIAHRNSTIDPAAAENPAAFSSSAEQWGAVTVALRPAPVGITSVTPDEFDMDNADVDVASSGGVFDASANDVYLSDADTLAGSANEVDVSSAINTEATTLINLDFTQLSAGELTSLHTLGPGARYVIVDATGGEYSWPVTLHRPQAFQMVLGAATPGSTLSRLTGLTGTFAGGRIEETAAQNPSTTTTNVASNGNREDVWSQEAKPNSREVSYDYRVLYGGNVPDTITQTPTVTISAGATAALTTVAATSAVGTLDKTLAKALTGTAAVGALGTLDKATTLVLTGTEATSAEGAVGVTKSGSLEISGVSGVAAVGAVGFTEAGSVGLTGVAGTSAVGSLTVANRDIAVSGVGATTDVGTPVATAEIPLSGDPATGAVGSVEAGGDVIVPVTGVSSSAAVGSVGFTEAGSAGITGVQNAAAVGSLTVGNRDISLLGEAASSAVGSVQGERSIALDGVPATSQIGSISAAAAGSAGITGVEGPTAIGVFTAHHDVASSGIQSVAAAGNITSEISVTLTGIQATGQAGSVSVDANVTAALTGVQAVAGVGSFFFPGGAALQTYRGMMANVGRMMNG